jgi:creatinine amidohydrolase
LRFETAENLIVDVVSSLARYGPRRFYIINTGVSTLGTLEAAASALASKGLLLRYTNLLHANETVERQVRQEEGGTHAGSRPSLPRFARRFTPKSAPADIA